MANSTLNQWIKAAVDAYNSKPKKENKGTGRGIRPIPERVEKWSESEEVIKLAEEIVDQFGDSVAGREAIRMVATVLPKDKAATGPKINPDDLVNLFDQKRKYTGAEVAEMLRKATG